MQQKRAYWRRLDHAAKMYSATSNDKITRVFRFYCVLKETIKKETLQKALDLTLETYPVFLSVMRKGVFWNYLEKSSLRPVVREEDKEPCSSLYIRDKKSLLFEVTYYKSRINFEVFHALTDGTGATEFLRELVKNYIYLSHEKEGIEKVTLLDERVTIQDQECDSFAKYYTKVKKKNQKKVKAYQIKKPKKESGSLRVHEATLSVEEVLEKSRQLGVSMTVFLTTLFLMAIHREMTKVQEKNPVVLMVPVNLRKFFPSDSMLNFFHYITPGYHFGAKEGNFEDVLMKVKKYFAEELTVEKVAEHMNELIALEVHPLLRLAPLQIKNLGIRAGAKYAERDVTAIFSNMSVVKMPEQYEPYIERFGVYTNTPKLELCMCSFQDKISLGFTSRFDTINIQRSFYELLKEQGITVTAVEPAFPDTKSQKEKERKLFRLYSFLCFVIGVCAMAVEVSFHPATKWSLFVAGGVLSTWLTTGMAYKKRHNLLKNAMWQLLILSAGSVLWDVCTGWYRWSVNFVLPVLSMIVLLFMFIVSRTRKDTPREYMSYFVMESCFGIAVPLLLEVMKIVKWTLLSNLCIVVNLLFLAGIIIFKGKEFKEEMDKKFHV